MPLLPTMPLLLLPLLPPPPPMMMMKGGIHVKEASARAPAWSLEPGRRRRRRGWEFVWWCRRALVLRPSFGGRDRVRGRRAGVG